MSSTFFTYLQLGFHHIFDLQAYDHLVFILAMCALYTAYDWRRILVLVTCFTVGHSITLALSTLEIIRFNTAFIELLIPITILLTCFYNFSQMSKNRSHASVVFNWSNFYVVAFGLIHGLGFSNYLKSLLGNRENIVLELLAFNVGIELGQLLIVVLVLILSAVLVQAFRLTRRDWILGVSAAAGAIALMLILEQDFSAIF
ncbi:HupE/UreJ family protein [Rufibacter sp. LB8]|uniref:HupE/UreJ family protein n=1 Tax=Rufibacter sp. LB8 TaxID=2777781 RepID=UPI00178C6574